VVVFSVRAGGRGPCRIGAFSWESCTSLARKGARANMIANQPEAVDDVDKSHAAGMVLPRNSFPCVDTFRTLACQGLSE